MENWYLFVLLGASVIVGIVAIYKFLELPTAKQIENIKEWLKYAVTIAEKELGSGTGQLKLRMVYQMFLEQFPEFSKLIPFVTFSAWVNEALEWMKQQLDLNKNVKSIVEGEK